MANLVGQIVIHSLRNRSDGYNHRKILILEEYYTPDKKRRYRAKELPGNKPVDACADTYDKLFLVKKGAIRGNHAFKGDSPFKLKVNY